MSNKLKEEIDIKNPTYNLSNDMINVGNLDPNKIKIDEKPCGNIPIYYIAYMTVKDLSYSTIKRVILYTLLSIN